MAKHSKNSGGSFDESGPAYHPDRDGSLEQYLETHDGDAVFPLFKGSVHFELLRKEGRLQIRHSIIRLMHNLGRGDEHFEVTEDFHLEGVSAGMHSGREGVFTPGEVLDAPGAPFFEASNLRHPRIGD